MIDSKNGIVSCSTADLTVVVTREAIEQVGKLDKLTFLYLPDADAFVLNKDNKNHAFYEMLVSTYVGQTPKVRETIKNALPAGMLPGMFNILDAAIKMRETKTCNRRCDG